MDQVLGETAGNFTLLEEWIRDTAIQKRLKGCVPWVKAFEPIAGGGDGAIVRRSSAVCSGRWLDGAGTWSDGDRVSAAPGGGLVIPLCVPNERDPPPQQLIASGATINLFLAAFDTTRRDRYCRDKTVENPPAESPARLRSARCG